ncbi:MAG: hypothetical protein E6J14_14210 [Chloroflexi bacterium]|nr:MAG: hypothetical protein E6J14_14210 [Chloroflexota bacterium]
MAPSPIDPPPSPPASTGAEPERAPTPRLVDRVRDRVALERVLARADGTAPQPEDDGNVEIFVGSAPPPSPAARATWARRRATAVVDDSTAPPRPETTAPRLHPGVVPPAAPGRAPTWPPAASELRRSAALEVIGHEVIRPAARPTPAKRRSPAALVLAGALLAVIAGTVTLLPRQAVRPGVATQAGVVARAAATAGVADTAEVGVAEEDRPRARRRPPVTALLSDARHLGDGARGVAVRTVRYGVHGGALRIVFDLSRDQSRRVPAGAAFADAPDVVVGRLAPTVYVIAFAGVTSTGVPTAPPSPWPGTLSLSSVREADLTVFRLTLPRPAHIDSVYLAQPQRLVLDLR